MKLTVLVLALFTAIACGKKNESGKPELKKWQATPYTSVQEEEFRRDFVQTAQTLIRVHGQEMKVKFGLRKVGLMRNRMTLENVQVTEQIIMNDRNEIVRSFHRHGVLYLYIGQGNLDWIRAKAGNQFQFKKLVLHEVLEMAEIDDRNFRHSESILRR